MQRLGTRVARNGFGTPRGVRQLNWLRPNAAYIDGEWVSGGGKTFDVQDPGNGEVLAALPDLTAQDCTQAIDAASTAFEDWRMTTGKERCEVLRDVFLLHREHVDELGKILAQESGKPLAEAKGEIMYGASYFEWFAEEAKRTYGMTIPEPSRDRRVITFKEPVGVCGLLTPWNFPNAMIARKAAPAIAAGCTTVIKPASQTPLSTLAIAAMCERAGLPKGVLNVVTSSDSSSIGKTITTDPRVRKVSFTGSTRVGSILLKSCADTVKKVSMELGGDAPFIVFADADMDAAVEGLMAGKFRNAGQTCVCPNRVLVQREAMPDLAARLADRMGSLRLGHCLEEGVTMGPLISEGAVETMLDFVQDATAKGAKLVSGGRRLGAEDGMSSANFFAPTVLSGCTQDMKVMQQELFGPIIALAPFDTEADAVRLANDTESGLAAYMFSGDLERCMRLSRRVEAGMIGVNTGLISTEVAPFGGIKQSGLGREGGPTGMDDYTETKYLAITVRDELQ